MDNRAQISVEYLIVTATGLIFAAVLLLFVGNIFSIKDGLKNNIQLFRSKFLQAV